MAAIQTDVEALDPKADSTSNNMISDSDRICCTELLDTSIEEVRNKKEVLVSTMDSVRKLMREVECEEKAANNATFEATLGTLRALVKIRKRNQAIKHAQETKNMVLARKLSIEKDVLAIKMELLHRRVANMLNVGDQSLDALNEICKALNKRLTSATSKKDLANKRKAKYEAALLANQELEIKKLVKELNKLKHETSENSKLQELLKDLDQLTVTLNGEMTDQYQDVNLLKV